MTSETEDKIQTSGYRMKEVSIEENLELRLKKIESDKLKREHFAIVALSGFLAKGIPIDQAIQNAVLTADKLILELNKPVSKTAYPR